MTQVFPKSPVEEQELKRRADAARVQSILEPQNEAARAEWRAAQRERERRRAEAAESQKTDHFARWFLLALLATVLLFLAQWLWTNSAV